MAEEEYTEEIDPAEVLEMAARAKASGNLAMAARMFNTAGNIYMSVAEYEEALQAFQESLDLYRQAEEEVGAADALYNLGVALINLECWADAAATCDEAVKLFQKISNDAGSADALYGLALAKLGMGEFDEAMSLFKKAQRAYKALGNEQGVATIVMDMGNAYADREDWVNAEKSFKKALKIYQELGDPAGIADAYSLIGDIAEINNNQRKAAESFVEAAEHYLKADLADVAREAVERAESKLWDIPKSTRRRLRKRIDDIIDALPEETAPSDDDEGFDDLLDFDSVE
ncbi:MAG: tetratricopeptide repeat protein [Candidatus Thorarchaeota archaeon]